MQFVPNKVVKDAAQMRGLAPGASENKKRQIPTWLIILIIVLFVGVVSWFLIV